MTVEFRGADVAKFAVAKSYRGSADKPTRGQLAD